jgi:hypothetical protein
LASTQQLLLQKGRCNLLVLQAKGPLQGQQQQQQQQQRQKGLE